MNKTILIIVAVIIIGIGGYFLLKGGNQAPAQSPTPAPEIAPGEVEEKIVFEIEEIIVKGSEFAFSPSTITVTVGEQVTINFQNEGSAIHNLVIEGLGVSSRTIGGDNSDIVEFIAPASGTYTVFCSVPGHRAAGMIGSLKVE